MPSRSVRLLPLVLLPLGACGANAPTYFPAGATLEAGGDDLPGDVSGTVAVTFRTPTETEQRQRQQLTDQLGFEVPRLRGDRVHVEVRYTVKNVSSEEGTFYLRLDGASEFYRYDQAAVAAAFEQNGEDPITLGLIQTVPQTLAPGQVYQGIVREDDFREAALDLDAMGRWMAPFASMLINRSEVNPGWPACAPAQACIGMEMVPPNLIRPALWEVTVHFLPSVHMSLTFLVRVRDDDQMLWQAGDEAFVPEPATYMPMLEMMGG